MLESCALMAVYAVILSGALQLGRIEGTPGWHRAWRGAQLMAGFIILSQLCALLVVLGVPHLTSCMHPLVGRLRAWLSAAAWLGVIYELMLIFSRRVR